MRGALLAVALLAPAARAGVPPPGILILAHGGDEKWNAEVERLRVEVGSRAAVAFGMADPEAIQSAVDELEKKGISSVVAVPLFVNSASEVMDQTRYVLGLSDTPSEVLRAAAERMKSMPMPPGMAHHHMRMFSLKRVKSRSFYGLAPALNGDEFVSRILAEHAKALSKDPRTETVILVAHGPVDDAAMPAWEKDMAAHASYIKKSGGYRAVKIGLLRDDAAPAVRAAAVGALRATVADAARNGGRAVVVPLLIARGGIEDKIPRDLAGLEFAWSGEALLPHSGFADWVRRRALDAGALERR